MSGSLTPRSSDLLFVQTNDRYQVVASPKPGTSTTTVEFRYWYANAPLWGEGLTSTSSIPTHFTTDEFSEYAPGSLELPYKEFKVGQEANIEGVLVEFIPRPSALSETTVVSGYSVGFSGRVEGHGVPNIVRTVSTTTSTSISSGTLPSDTFSHVSTAGAQASDVWPNVRTIYLPVRLRDRVRAVRVVFTDIHLVAIRKVQVIGTMHPIRTV